MLNYTVYTKCPAIMNLDKAIVIKLCVSVNVYVCVHMNVRLYTNGMF